MRIWPEYIELDYFAAQLVEEYPNEILPQLIDNEKWPDWAAAVSAKNLFSKANVPNPFSIQGGVKQNNFTTWQEWAKAAYICMNSAIHNQRNQ